MLCGHGAYRHEILQRHAIVRARAALRPIIAVLEVAVFEVRHCAGPQTAHAAASVRWREYSMPNKHNNAPSKLYFGAEAYLLRDM